MEHFCFLWGTHENAVDLLNDPGEVCCQRGQMVGVVLVMFQRVQSCWSMNDRMQKKEDDERHVSERLQKCE